MSKDLRVRITKQLIQDKFFQLLQEKPLNKITVKAICDEAKINRSTFYKYFADPYDLIEKVEAELLQKTSEFFKISPNLNITETVLFVLDVVMKHKEIYKTILSENGDPHFIDRMLGGIYTAKISSMENLFPNLSDAQKEWLFRFITYGSTNIIISWIKSNFNMPATAVAAFIDEMNSIILEGVKKRF